MKVDFTTSGFVVNKAKTHTALLFHKKLKKRMQPGGHIEPGEFPHEAAAREIKEELGISCQLDPIYHQYSELLKTSVGIVPNPIATYRQIIPQHKEESEHLHCDLWFVYIASKKDTFSGEKNESKRFSKKEVLDLTKQETFSSVQDFAHQVLVNQ